MYEVKHMCKLEKNFSFSIYDLTTGYMRDPIGIDADCISFGWKMRSEIIGKRQCAYEINVFDADRPVWTSGKTESGISVGIEYTGSPLEKGKRYSWNVCVWDSDGKCAVSEDAFFETGVSGLEIWEETDFISAEASSSAPIFRTEKKLSGKVCTYARLYITAMGVYKAYINGYEVTASENGEKRRHHMNPGYGDRDVCLGYQTYDVTDLVDSDAVAVSAVCGTGWYNGMWAKEASPALKALLVITYEDGTKQYIGTNTSDSKCTLEGPVTANGIYYGEDYDARKAYSLGDFTSVGYDDSAWQEKLTNTKTFPGKIRSALGTVGKMLEKYSKVPVSVTVYSGEKTSNDCVGGEIDISELITAENGNYDIFENGISFKKGSTVIVDMGQNMSAVPKISFSAEKGTVLTMRFAEMLNDGSKVGKGATDADGPRGSIYQKSIRGARSRVEYTFAGDGIEHYTTSTSFFGYRYIELTATDDVTVYSLRSCALSSVSEQTGHITTSNENINKLFSNVIYGQLSNYFTTSTDCNQRDERLFWSGDTQAFVKTGLYNFNSFAFFRDLQAVMDENAMIKGYAPSVADDLHGFFSNWAAGWSDALVIVPWNTYLQTGDRSVLKKSYVAMTKYMDWLKENERGKDQSPISHMNFGDWLSFQGTCVEVISDYYYGYVTDIMSKTAEILGDEAEAAEYREKFNVIKEKFIKTHVTFDNGKLLIKSGTGDTSKQFHYGFGKGGLWEDNSQTSLLWMLKLGFYKNEAMRDAAIALLTENIKNESPEKDSIRSKYGKNTLAVGFLGSNVILPVLSGIGCHSRAYDLLLQDENPSWLFEVKAGATTVWERWNSFTPCKGFGDAEMNSFNHYAYGSVLEWMYRYMLGIDSSEKDPGFKKVILQPTFDSGEKYNDESRIKSVNGSYDSLYGKISVAWESDGDSLKRYSAVLPANTSGELYLPLEEATAKSISEINGVKYEGMCVHNGQRCAEFTLLSGGYEFTSNDGTLTVKHI